MPLSLPFLQALRRSERLAEAIARIAARRAASGRPQDMETARMALEAHRRATELREHFEAALPPGPGPGPNDA